MKAICGAFWACLVSALVLPAVARGSEVLTLPVPVRNIMQGEVLSAAALTGKSFALSPVAKRNYAIASSQLVGLEAGRTLAAGKPIALSWVRHANMVRRGETVQATYSDAGIELRATLLALEDGAVGQTIKAKNTATGLPVNIMVTQRGQAQVVGP